MRHPRDESFTCRRKLGDRHSERTQGPVPELAELGIRKRLGVQGVRLTALLTMGGKRRAGAGARS